MGRTSSEHLETLPRTWHRCSGVQHSHAQTAAGKRMLSSCPPCKATFFIAGTLSCMPATVPARCQVPAIRGVLPSLSLLEESAAVGSSVPQTSGSGGWRFIQPSLLAKLLLHILQATKRNKNEIIHMQLQWVKYPMFTVA